MAFLINNFGRITSSQADVPASWTYESSTDTLATIKASGYFDAVGVTSQNVQVDETIKIQGSDGVQVVRITAVSPAVTVVLFDALGQAFFVAFGGTPTTAGGATTEVFTVTGATSSDIALANIQTEGATPVTLDAVITGTDNITVEFSADPSTDTVISFMVFRAV